MTNKVTHDNIREKYDAFFTLYTKTQDVFIKTGKSDNAAFIECIHLSGHITEFLETLHPTQYLKYNDIPKSTFLIRAELLIRTVGLDTTKPGLQESDKLVYHSIIHLLRKVLAQEPFNGAAMELFKVVFIYLTIYNLDVKEIVVFLKQVESVYPHDYQLQYNLGFAYQRLNDLENAIIHYKLSNGIIDIHLKTNPEGQAKSALEQFKLKCLNSLGSVYYSVQDRPVAAYYFKLGLAMEFKDPDLHNQLGVVYTELRDTQKAIWHYKNGIKFIDSMSISSDKNMLLASLYMNMGLCICYECDFEGAIQSYNKALEYKPRLSLAYQNKLLDLNYISHLIDDPMYIAKMHKNLNKIYEKVVSNYKKSLPDYKPKQLLNYSKAQLVEKKVKLVIGFVSGDFICHPVSYFIKAILERLNPGIFDVICYTCKLINVEGAFPNCKWTIIKGMNNEKLASTIKEDKVDILFDLSGHTGDNRLDTFVLKPAPIQISYCGYPGSSGIKSIDYRFTDKIADCPLSEKYYQEKLVYLDKCFLNYTSSLKASELPLGEQPYKKNGYITFGCFNRYNKINKMVIGVWEQILGTIPDARFIIKTKEFTTDKLKKQFLDSFKDQSIIERITVIEYSESYNAHLPDYNLMDISLDTFPYAGTTTSCESLFMGVPVLTLRDNVKHLHSQNVTSSLLTFSNLSEYIANDVSEYITMAIEYGTKGVPSDLKESTRRAFLEGDVSDHAGFVDSFENTILDVYRNHAW
jgi:predicted O-linked N-acetylglucosamine transferase (SPINDLY family)